MPAGNRLADPPADPVVRTVRARLAAHVRHGNADQAAIARRELEVQKVAGHVKRLAPLTADELGHLLAVGRAS
jgi:hypothetical protein